MARGKRRKWEARLKRRQEAWDQEKGDVPFKGTKIIQPTGTAYRRPGSQKK